MARKVDQLAALIEASRALEQEASGVQRGREVVVEPAFLDSLVGRYQAWFAHAIAVLPSEFGVRFRAEYEGNWHSRKIKAFLTSPGERSALGGDNDDGTPSPFPFWSHPFDTSFRGPLLAQRQILAEAQQQLSGGEFNEDLELVERICRGFGEFVVPLANRQRSRPAIVMEDEYDVQDFVHGLLRIHFDDVRPEDFAPERAGGKSRVDFVLKRERIVVEAKMTRERLGSREIGEELIVDIERYRSHPDAGALVALVYDPAKRIKNPRGLEADLSGERDGLSVRVVVVH